MWFERKEFGNGQLSTQCTFFFKTSIVLRFATLTYIVVIHVIMGLWLIFSLKLLDKYLFPASMTWLSHRGGPQGFRQSESFVFFEGAYTSIFKQEDEIIGTIPAQCRPGGGRRSCLERKWGAALKKVKTSCKCSPFSAYLDFYSFSCAKKSIWDLDIQVTWKLWRVQWQLGQLCLRPAEFLHVYRLRLPVCVFLWWTHLCYLPVNVEETDFI